MDITCIAMIFDMMPNITCVVNLCPWGLLLPVRFAQLSLFHPGSQALILCRPCCCSSSSCTSPETVAGKTNYACDLLKRFGDRCLATFNIYLHRALTGHKEEVLYTFAENMQK